MSTPITNNPRGLVSLLGLRDMGGVPRSLISEIQTGIDVTQLLLIDRQVRHAYQNFNSVTNLPFFTVPAGELWYIHAFGGRSAALTAGQRIRMGALVQNDTNGLSCPYGATESETNVGAQCMCVANAGFWLNPGGTLLIQVTDIAAGPIQVLGAASISVLRV